MGTKVLSVDFSLPGTKVFWNEKSVIRRYAWPPFTRTRACADTAQTCPWVGLTHGLGRDFAVFDGLGWAGSNITKVLCFL